jgi:protein tyrosine phosphatase (PTP) superfamily phosphohydrolase (DUF442 family)
MSAQIWVDVPDACSPADGECTGGRLQPEHIRQAKERGIRAVIDLCSPSEPCAYDEPSQVRSLGMQCLNIPIAGGRFAVKAQFIEGLDLEQALAAGRAAGLKVLELAACQIPGR